MKSSRFQVIIEGNEGGAIFDGGNAIAPLELLAQVGSGETYLAGHIGDGHLRMVGQQVVGHFHTYRVDILRKGHAIGKGIKLVVQVMTANAKALHDVFAHQVDLCVEAFVANDSVDGFKEVLVHLVLNLSAKLNKNDWIRKRTYARIWYMAQMRALNAIIFVNIESVLRIPLVVRCSFSLKILAVISGCYAVFSFKLFTKIGRRKSDFVGDG